MTLGRSAHGVTVDRLLEPLGELPDGLAAFSSGRGASPRPSSISATPAGEDYERHDRRGLGAPAARRNSDATGAGGRATNVSETSPAVFPAAAQL